MPRNPRLLHRRVHLNDLPDYLISGGSNQLILHQTRPTSASSASQYDDNSGTLVVERDRTPRSYASAPRKRHYDSEWTHPSQEHVVTERVIPVSHQRPNVVHEQKPMVGEFKFRLNDYFLASASIRAIT